MTEIIDLLEYTGEDKWNAVYTVCIGELKENGVFDWSRPELDWSSAAYDDNQYKRVCDYFEQRFMFREISIEPFYEWAVMLKRRLVYELMPKYKILYSQAERQWDIATGGIIVDTSNLTKLGTETRRETDDRRENKDDYFKERSIDSEYPETLLSSNSDYITDGKDTENEREIENKYQGEVNYTSDLNGSANETRNKTQTVNTVEYMEAISAYIDRLGQIDMNLLDELESMFISMYTANVNASW